MIIERIAKPWYCGFSNKPRLSPDGKGRKSDHYGLSGASNQPLKIKGSTIRGCGFPLFPYAKLLLKPLEWHAGTCITDNRL